MREFPLISFENLYNFGHYLSIVAPFDFKNGKGNCSVFSRIHCATIGFTVLACAIISSWYRSELISTFRTSVKISDCINEAIILISYFTLKYANAIWKNKTWEILFQQLSELNPLLQTNKEKRSVEKFITLQVSSLVIFIFLTVQQWWFLYQTGVVSIPLIATYGVHYYCGFNLIYFLIIINTILLDLEKKFKTLKRQFEQRLPSCMKLHISRDYTPKTVDFIRRTGGIFRKLGDCVHTFNALFGYSILSIFASFVFNIIVMINVSFVSESLAGKAKVVKPATVAVSNIFTTAFQWVWIILLVHLCERVISAAKQTIDLCFIFEEKFAAHSEEREELLKLVKLAQSKLPAFSASNYFEINKSALLSTFATVTTYVIVLVQINIAMY